jgi:hypothetical protein
LTVGIAALAIGLVAFLFLPKLGFSPAGNPLTVAAGSATSSSPSASPSAGAPQSTAPSGTDASSEAPAASGQPSADATPSITSEDAQVVDKTQPVAVYNGTTTAGLAGRVGSSVSAAGWTLGPVGNWGGVPQKTSVIYYSGAAQKGSAEALGNLLRITTLVDSAEFGMPVVVVLGPGFQ